MTGNVLPRQVKAFLGCGHERSRRQADRARQALQQRSALARRNQKAIAARRRVDIAAFRQDEDSTNSSVVIGVEKAERIADGVPRRPHRGLHVSTARSPTRSSRAHALVNCAGVLGFGEPRRRLPRPRNSCRTTTWITRTWRRKTSAGSKRRRAKCFMGNLLPSLREMTLMPDGMRQFFRPPPPNLSR